jgi:hypothetical protein
MKRVLLSLIFSAALFAAGPPRVSRDAMTSVEQSVDQGIRALDVNAPYDLLGFTRGVYLPGYGVVLTSEVNLVVTLINPFSPAPTGIKLTQLRQKKIQRLEVVRGFMRDALVSAALTLDPVPANEQVVYGMTLFYRKFEEREGLPGQIIIQAPRQTLLDYKANRISKAQLDAAIQVQEL